MKTNVARLLMAAGVLFGVTLATAGPAAADCPAPSISISPSSGRGGDTFRISGQNFFQSCSDAGNVGDTNIQFRFLQGGNVYDLGSATAGTPGGDFSGTLFVPTNTTAGSATVQAFGANGAPAVPFQVTQSTTAGGGATPATTPRSTATTARSTATTAAPASAATTTTVVPAPPAATTGESTTSTTAAATTVTTAAPASSSSSSSKLNGGGLAVTILLLLLVVIGTIIASLATAGRLPLPKGRPRPRVERAAAAEAAEAAEAAAAAAAVGAAPAVVAAGAFDEPHEPDRYESSTAPIAPIPDPFAPEPDEPTAAVESAALLDHDDEEPSAPLESSSFDDEEPSAAVESADDDHLADEPEPDRYASSRAPIEPHPDPYVDDEPANPVVSGDELAFPDDEEHT